MRVKRTFGERTSFFDHPQEEKIKYIVAYEGQETEVQYFNGLIDNKREIGVKNIIDILPLLRGVLHASTSHPQRNLEFLVSHLEQYSTARTIIEKMVDYCEENSCCGLYSLSELEDNFKTTFRELYPDISLDTHLPQSQEVITALAGRCSASAMLAKSIPKINAYIQDQEITYIPGYDQICLIVDRDKGNFSTEQYEEVRKQCDTHTIRLFVSNPTFEFWLLLHSENVFAYSSSELLENKKAGDKRELERILTTVFDGYSKSDIKFSEKFSPHIRMAINQARQFCEDVGPLESALGTNIGILMDELLEERP